MLLGIALIVIFLLVYALLMMEQICPYFGFMVGVFVLPFAIEKDAFFSRVFLGMLVFSSTLHLLVGGLKIIHHNDDTIEMVTGYYEFGQNIGLPMGISYGRYDDIDTLALNSYYMATQGIHVQKENFYVLYSDSTILLFSADKFSTKKERLKCRTLFIYEKDLGHGELHVCAYTDTNGYFHEVDLNGGHINNPDYHPYVYSVPDPPVN